LGSISQKIFKEDELREKVTIRVLPEKMQIYPRFKELVTKRLGSDVCFVTTSLWEAFLQAMDRNPPADQPIEMRFLRQNVQINIGCKILYQPKKARRYPEKKQPDPGFPYFMDRNNNYILPGFLDQWDDLNEDAKQFWRERLMEKGIIQTPPSVSSGASRDKPLKKFLKLCWQSMTIVSRWIKSKLWSE
jgi:hypothetical protein